MLEILPSHARGRLNFQTSTLETCIKPIFLWKNPVEKLQKSYRIDITLKNHSSEFLPEAGTNQKTPYKKTKTGSQNQTNHIGTKLHIFHAKILLVEKILGLAGQGVGSISKPYKSSMGRKKKLRIKPQI